MLCDYRLATVAATYRELFDGSGNRRTDGRVFESNPHGPAVLEDYNRIRACIISTLDKNSPPYKRQTYFNERIKQWLCEEPEIPEDHWWRIRLVYQSNPEASTKESVRRLLGLVNEREGTTLFTRKYFVSYLFRVALTTKSIRRAWLGQKGIH